MRMEEAIISSHPPKGCMQRLLLPLQPHQVSQTVPGWLIWWFTGSVSEGLDKISQSVLRLPAHSWLCFTGLQVLLSGRGCQQVRSVTFISTMLLLVFLVFTRPQNIPGTSRRAEVDQYQLFLTQIGFGNDSEVHSCLVSQFFREGSEESLEQDVWGPGVGLKQELCSETVSRVRREKTVWVRGIQCECWRTAETSYKLQVTSLW